MAVPTLIFFHFEPDHAAQHTVGLFLVQLPRFFQTFGLLIFSDRVIIDAGSSLFFSLFFYFNTDFDIILL